MDNLINLSGFIFRSNRMHSDVYLELFSNLLQCYQSVAVENLPSQNIGIKRVFVQVRVPPKWRLSRYIVTGAL